MLTIKNNLIPFRNFTAMNLFGIIFIREDNWSKCSEKLKAITLNHEKIHTKQQIELLFIGFFIVYFFEWIFKGYRNISFEKEAYRHEMNLDYLKERKHYAQWRKKKK